MNKLENNRRACKNQMQALLKHCHLLKETSMKMNKN